MNYNPVLLTISVFVSGTLIAMPASAQTTTTAQPVELSNDENSRPTRRIVREVEPLNYWVEAEKLPIRDNPVAGDVNGMLKLGQKVKVYDRFENWLRISKTGATEKWVNANYLTTDQLTWARFDNKRRRSAGFSRSNLVDDVSLKRIKIPSDKDARVYAASIKATANNNRVIVTRQNFRAGPYFEKRLVSCAENGVASRFQLLGEGHSYMMMEKDIRAQGVDVNTASPRTEITNSSATPKTLTIVNYSCESQNFISAQ